MKTNVYQLRIELEADQDTALLREALGGVLPPPGLGANIRSALIRRTLLEALSRGLYGMGVAGKIHADVRMGVKRKP